jgi:toxin YoeB
MALELLFSPQFADSLEEILQFYDERNGSDRFSKKLMKMILKQTALLKTMPEIGRQTDFPGVRILFVDRYGIEYQIRDKVILIIDIFSCQTDPEARMFKSQ